MHKNTKKYLYTLLMEFHKGNIDFDDVCETLDGKIIEPLRVYDQIKNL